MLGILKDFQESETTSTWLSLLDGRNPFQLLYSLQIVESLIAHDENKMVCLCVNPRSLFFLLSSFFFFSCFHQR